MKRCAPVHKRPYKVQTHKKFRKTRHNQQIFGVFPFDSRSSSYKRFWITRKHDLARTSTTVSYYAPVTCTKRQGVGRKGDTPICCVLFRPDKSLQSKHRHLTRVWNFAYPYCCLVGFCLFGCFVLVVVVFCCCWCCWCVLVVFVVGAVWESRWPSWAVRHNEPSGFRGRKAILNHALAWPQLVPNMSTDIRRH